ncbi:hypothetical protein C818_00998 [Lachnospiraceae bacterium MD308]|nr:hypothetical protein C818_00998 [Lachnospiraceae bacterium MD308]
MLDNIYWTYDENNVSLSAERKLLIVGQSGSGKTTLARYLCMKYPELFEIIKNCTTRLRREDDEEEFCYLSVDQFIRAKENSEFFFARFGAKPLYGYKKVDYEKIVCSKKIPIFLFRFSGLQHLRNLMKNYYVIFLISELDESLLRSKDEISNSLFLESKFISEEIKNTISEFEKNKRKYVIVNNNYKEDFFTQITEVIIKDIINT